jgi:hypothetical protein
MSNDYSSFNKDKKIFDGWRQFLNESAAPGAVLDEGDGVKTQKQDLQQTIMQRGNGDPIPNGEYGDDPDAPMTPQPSPRQTPIRKEELEELSVGSISHDGKELEEKRFANDKSLDHDGDGKPHWADKDDKDEKLEEQGPAGIEIDPVAQAAMEQRPEFDDLGIEDDKSGGRVYRTADLDTYKFGSDMDFLSNRTPLPSLSMAYRANLLNPETNMLTKLGRGVVKSWRKQYGMQENLNFDYIIQEVYKRLTRG